MQGKAFLDTAKKLLLMRDEPALRTAVSRSYYAAYNFCIQLFEVLGFHFGKDSPAHEKVYHYLHNAGITEIEAAADDLRVLRKHRNIADYDMASKEFQNHIVCQGDLVRAQGIILVIEKYSREPLRTQLRNGVREYVAKISSSPLSSQAP
jgi:hypothetical protein